MFMSKHATLNTGAVGADSVGMRAARPTRFYVEASWVLGVVLFTVARFFVATGTLKRYGLNVWVFGAIDLLTAVPYGLGTARTVGALVDRDHRAASRWSLVAAVSFLAPYLYIAWAGQTATFPPAVYIVVGLLLAVFGANAVWGVVRKVRAERAARLAAPS
jgi:hypothetical protein